MQRLTVLCLAALTPAAAAGLAQQAEARTGLTRRGHPDVEPGPARSGSRVDGVENLPDADRPCRGEAPAAPEQQHSRSAAYAPGGARAAEYDQFVKDQKIARSAGPA